MTFFEKYCLSSLREQAKEGTDPYVGADGLRLRPSQGLETGSREGNEFKLLTHAY